MRARGLLELLAMLLALAARVGEGKRLQPGLDDPLAALGAVAVGSFLQPPEGLVDLLQRLGLHFHQGEVHAEHEVFHALLLGVLHLRGLGGQYLPEQAQLVLDLRLAVAQHAAEHFVSLPIADGHLAHHWDFSFPRSPPRSHHPPALPGRRVVECRKATIVPGPQRRVWPETSHISGPERAAPTSRGHPGYPFEAFSRGTTRTCL